MIELPLFPLNLVLFPGMPLELHIFEERYKLLIGRCIENRSPFGVVLLEQGSAEQHHQREGQPPKPFSIGCTAEITHVKPLDDGRMNITVIGKERFEIVSMHEDEPYLVSMVNLLPMPNGDTYALVRGAQILRQWVARYLKVLDDAGQFQLNVHELPHDPVRIGYLGAVLLQGVPMAQKQTLLESDEMVQMIYALHKIYRYEVVLLEAMLKPPDSKSDALFSLN